MVPDRALGREDRRCGPQLVSRVDIGPRSTEGLGKEKAISVLPWSQGDCLAVMLSCGRAGERGPAVAADLLVLGY